MEFTELESFLGWSLLVCVTAFILYFRYAGKRIDESERSGLRVGKESNLHRDQALFHNRVLLSMARKTCSKGDSDRRQKLLSKFLEELEGIEREERKSFKGQHKPSLDELRKELDELVDAGELPQTMAAKGKGNDFVDDPKERDSRYAGIIRKAANRAEREIQKEFGAQASCHMVWFRQKEILKEEHAIDWRTPAEMNPNVLFD